MQCEFVSLPMLQGMVANAKLTRCPDTGSAVQKLPATPCAPHRLPRLPARLPLGTDPTHLGWRLQAVVACVENVCCLLHCDKGGTTRRSLLNAHLQLWLRVLASSRRSGWPAQLQAGRHLRRGGGRLEGCPDTRHASNWPREGGICPWQPAQARQRVENEWGGAGASQVLDGSGPPLSRLNPPARSHQ